MACVPTIYADLLRYADEHKPDLSSLRMAICGGAPMPPALARALEERHGVRMLHAWGMTETSPMGTVANEIAGLDDAESWRAARQAGGRGAIRRAAAHRTPMGEELAHDGVATGELEVRGPWVARSYYKEPPGAEDRFRDGWLRTGDVANVDARGYVEITDRSKDVIKSGGEWISSVELENQLMAHDGGPRSRGDRAARRALGRAPAGLRRTRRGRGYERRRADRASAPARRELLAARRVRVP